MRGGGILYDERRLFFHLFSLCFGLLTSVPESNNVDNVVIDAIDQLAQAINNDAAIDIGPVTEEWIDGTNIRVAYYHVDSLVNLLNKRLHALISEMLEDIVTNPISMPLGILSLDYLHTASAKSLSRILLAIFSFHLLIDSS